MEYVIQLTDMTTRPPQVDKPWMTREIDIPGDSKHPSSIFQSHASLFLVDEAQCKTTSTAATQIPLRSHSSRFFLLMKYFSVEDFQMFSLFFTQET